MSEPSTTWRMQQGRVLKLTGRIYQVAEELGVDRADPLLTVNKIASDTINDPHRIPMRSNGDAR